MTPKTAWRRLAIVLPLVWAVPAAADDEPLLEDPVGMIDVEPTPVGGFTLNLVGAFERVRSGKNRDTYGAGVEFEAGLVPGLDLRLIQIGAYGQAVPYPAEDGARRWGGETRAGLRWQILEENGALPAVGLYGAITSLYGESRPAQDAEALALFRKTLRGGERTVALYLNAGWSERLAPEPGERGGRYGFVAGIAHAVGHDTSVALSYQRAQQDRDERDLNLIQAGVFHRLSDAGPILGFSAGAGIGRDSPTLVLGVSLKFLFGEH